MTDLAEFAEGNGFRIMMLWDEAEELLSWPDQWLKCLRSALSYNKSLRVVLAATKRLS